MKENNTKINNLCTILIPTYNRPDRLKRLLDYYNKYGKNFNIIVADSSTDENKLQNKKNISTFSNLDILYLDQYSSKINPYHKFANMVNYVEKKYCVFCADDDFITPNGINKSVEFLENNPDFSCAHGHYICFYLKFDRVKKQQFCWTPSYPNKSINFSTAKSRFNFHFSNYYPTFYAVHRTDLLKMIFKDAVEYANDGQFGELLPSMLDLIYGKMKKLDVLYSAREIIFGFGDQTSKSLEDFIKNGTFEKKYIKFRECLAKALVSKEDISKEKAQKLIDKAMNKYLGSSMLKLKLIMGLKKINGLHALLKKFYHICRRPKTSKKKISVLDRAPAIECDNQENPYYEDFIRIQTVSQLHFYR